MGQNYSLLIGTGAALVGAIFMWKLLKNSTDSINSESKRLHKVALVDSNAKYPFKLIAKEILTHDTRRFRFELPSPDHVSGLPVGNHITISAKINGELVVRPYTPVSLEDDKGYFEIILKIYKSNVNSAFPNGGKMSQYIDSLKIGESIDVRGPLGRLRYLKNGIFEITHDKKKPPHIKKVNQLGMIAGGSGITPMFQLIKEICRRPDDQTKIQLIFSNTTENDILLRDELDSIEKQSLGKLNVWYTISKSDNPNWSFGLGRINEEMFVKYLPPKGDDTLILFCGPKGMDATATECLRNLGYSNEMVHRF